jgi:hypothetical protein
MPHWVVSVALATVGRLVTATTVAPVQEGSVELDGSWALVGATARRRTTKVSRIGLS